MAGPTIQSFVDELAERLQRSVAVDDAHVKFLYTSRHYGDEDEVRRRAVLQRDAGAQVVGYVLSQGITNWTTAGVIPANPELGLHTRVCVPIRWRGRLLGFLMVVDHDSSLTTGELSQLTRAAQDIGGLMLAERPPEQDERAEAVAEALWDLVSPDLPLRRSGLRALTSMLGETANRNVRILNLQTRYDRVGAVPGHAYAAFRHALWSEAPHPASWRVVTGVREDSAVVLVIAAAPVSGSTVRALGREIVDRVHSVAAAHFRCVVGIGGQRSGLEQAHASYRQAQLAAEAGRHGHPGPLIAWDELGELAVLLQLRLVDVTVDTLPDEVQRLLDYDRDGQSVQTVRAYLEHAGSAPRTAEALHLHRTSLYHRLERIREATGLDFDDGRTRLALHVGLRLRDLLEGAS